MPVEDRLRRGLEANARSFVPEGEWRLAQLHRRRRARAGVLAGAAAVSVAVAAGAAGAVLWNGDRAGAPQPVQLPTPAVTESMGPYAGPRIPDSGWRKVVTRAELVRGGAQQPFLEENLGSARRLPTTLNFIGKVFSHSGRFPGAWAVGDAGTLEYDRDGRLVLTSTSPGCRGCVMSLRWRLEGDRLVLSGFRGTPDDPVAEVMLEGVWTRLGG